MKNFKKVILFLVVVLAFGACNNKSKKGTDLAEVYQCPMKCQGDKIYSAFESCPICKMDLKVVADKSINTTRNNKISDESIFNLTSEWFTEENESIHLEALKGKTLVMVMIYTTCKAACPRLMADMRNIEKQIPEDKLEDLHFVLVSIDPKTDTPERLKAFAIENLMDAEHWTFLQGTESSVREFANVLAVKYKQISPMDFSHSNIISVFNSGGELIHQQEGLGVDNKETVQTIMQLTN
jgi:protein SCO1/2